MAAGPSASAAPFCGDRQDVAGRRLDHDQHRLAALGVDGVLGGVLHRAVQRDRHRRGRLRRHLVEDVDVGPVLVDADHPPARFAVQLVDDGLLDLTDDGRGEGVVGGQQVGLRGDHDPGQPVENRADPVVVGWPQGDQLERRARRTGLLGEPLWVQGVVEGAQRVGDDPRGRHQLPAGLRGIELVAIQVARHQHIGAAHLVDARPGAAGRRAARRSGARRVWGAGRRRSNGPAICPRRGSC